MGQHKGTVPIEPLREFLLEAAEAAGGMHRLAATMGNGWRGTKLRSYTREGRQKRIRCTTVDRILTALDANDLYDELCPEDQIVEGGGMTRAEREETVDLIGEYLEKRRSKARERSARRGASSGS